MSYIFTGWDFPPDERAPCRQKSTSTTPAFGDEEAEVSPSGSGRSYLRMISRRPNCWLSGPLPTDALARPAYKCMSQAQVRLWMGKQR
ncbi:MAG: hypothetical protein H6545_01670 [Bacteroidales bacterium]|nr:hypothetical protein [Bacteroidales bacterium]